MKRACGGFSLLEVLVAFVVLALVLGILMRVFSGALGNIGEAGQFSRAAAIAESRLAAAGVETPLAEGETTGTVEPGLRWKVAVSRADEAAAANTTVALAVALYRIDVTVGWGEAPTRREIALTSLRLGPVP
ncbi:type IV pilus modification PilV family protein [Immundisolibacter sp.]|jgi:general secretion pathway protein I